MHKKVFSGLKTRRPSGARARFILLRKSVASEGGARSEEVGGIGPERTVGLETTKYFFI